jgi:cyanophycin synthetase
MRGGDRADVEPKASAWQAGGTRAKGETRRIRRDRSRRRPLASRPRLAQDAAGASLDAPRPMQIRKIIPLMGPNIWANSPVIEAWVDLGHFEDFPSNTLPGFNDRIMRWLPTMEEHFCGVGERGGFFQRLRGGTWLGHVLEHVTLELHGLSYVQRSFGRARETSERGVYKVVVKCDDPGFAEACMRSGRELILAAVDDRPFDVTAEVRRLRELADQLCLGPSTQAIVNAAKERLIPAIRLTAGNLVQLGYGKAQRRIWTAETAHTGAIAEAIAQDKELTRKLLSGVGVPVPAGRIAVDPEDAWAAASELGLPVVVKPQDANHGRGVSIRLETRAAVEMAFQYAAKEGSGVVVERFIPGTQYRVLVVGEHAVAASGGEADQVVADGVHSIDELLALANQNPERGEDSAQPLTTLVLDDISLDLLRRQGLEPQSVPDAGRPVLIRYNGDLTVDETDRMHPDVAAHCVLAAQTVGLDVAGIDLIAEDIGRPLERQAGAIIEVNASPGLVMHLKPLVGRPRPVGEAIVNHLFREGESGRVPLVAVSGTNGKTTVAALVSSMLSAAGRAVGQADSTGVRARGRVLSEEDGATSAGARRVLMNPFVDSLVLEVSESGVLEEGLAFDRCDVAVVTNLGSGDHIGRTYVDELAVIAKAVRAPVDVVLPNGAAVLNAEDPEVVAMAEKCRGRVIYFGRSPDTLAMKAHLAGGNLGVTLEGKRVVAVRGGQREYIAELDRLSCAVLGLPAMFVDDLLAAVGAGLALGLTPSAVRTGIERAMGRDGVAIFEGAGTSALATPCRNPSALRAWLETLQGAFPGRPIHALVEIGADWRCEDASEIGGLLSQACARVGVIASGECPSLSAPLHVALGPLGTENFYLAGSIVGGIGQMVDELRPADLLFVLPTTRASQRIALACLAEKGMRRRSLSGLPSVEHCR